MFNGYNETPLISYNEFNQERIEKKQENVPKWLYGPDPGGQPVQTHSNNRHSEFWSGKSNFLGNPNLVKCNCAGCYNSTENQSYQGDTNRHRPWLPRTFPVPLNCSNESSKLPAYQWDNGLSSQNPCYPENSLQYVQENGGGRYPKYPYYRHYQNPKLPVANQPGVITSVKDAEYTKKSKNELPCRGLESPIQNATRQTEFCSSAYSLTKKVEERNYCNPNDKYSNVASCSVEQHISRVPVVEPFLKAVPSNLSQNRVPSTGYRSVKENIPQPYVDSGYGDARKICPEPTANSDKRNELFATGQLQTGVHSLDYSLFNRELQEEDQQKLYFDSTRHPDYYSRNNIQDMLKRNHLILDNRKDCAMNQISQVSMPEQQYNASRTKYKEVGNYKSSFEAFYPKEFEKTRSENHLPENAACFQSLEDTKNENANVHTRLSRSALLFNDVGFADKPQNTFPYQSNTIAYRNHLRSEYSYQNINAQVRFEYPPGFQRNDLNQYRVTSRQSCEQLVSQQGNGLVNNHYHQNTNKPEEICGQKNPSSVQTDFQALESRKTNYLESIRSEEISKNGTSKISPLRLLRKKKFINVPHESTPVSTLDSAPELDVRKFWSTWAEEEEDNVGPTQMVVLDCQNIDPEQVKLLTTPINLYDTDPVRPVHAENDRLIVKGSNCPKESNIQRVNFEENKTCQEPVVNDAAMNDERENSVNEKAVKQQEESQKTNEGNSMPKSEGESRTPTNELICPQKSPPKNLKKVKSGLDNREKKKAEIMDKWTEKKFDFLKRAEESKAAEVLRHEEEKKKIFETRLSLQQTFKKTQKLQEKNISDDESTPEKASLFDENSQSNSPEEKNVDAYNLPTSEYRRNKFLDYSDKKIILNGKNQIETTEVADIPTSNEIKNEKDIKLECWDKWLDKCQAENELPSLNAKIKEETGAEMNDILKKMSDINFQSSGIAVENEAELTLTKKWKPVAKKTKKKKSDQSTENEERTNKLTVETVSKPTIKFSIQKSHDLKISFKVLNSSKEYSDEDMGGEDAEAEGNTLEDSKNSTELITLKYKSIQRDCDRKQNLDFVKNKRGFRKKKRSLEMKTPVLKIKKSRYMEQEELDSLANDDECVTASKKPYLDEYATSDDFQVQETVDSAKIKLTFKRHSKGNFDTEYKINSNNGEVSEHESTPKENLEFVKTRKKSKRANQEFFGETGDECFQEFPELSTIIESSPESEKPQLEPFIEENPRKSPASPGACTEKENEDRRTEGSNSSVLPYSDFPSDPKFPVPTPEISPLDYVKLAFSEENENRDTIEDSKSYRETNKCDQEQVEFIVNHVINCDEGNGSADNRDEFSLFNCNASASVNLKELTLGEVESLEESQEKTVDFNKEEIQEISLDFIRSTKPPEIEINHELEKTEETKILLNAENNTETLNKKSSDSGDISEVKHSNSLENFCESKSEIVNTDEKANELEDSKIIEDSYYWKDDSLCNDAVHKSMDNVFENVKERGCDSEETSIPSLSLLELENYNFRKNFATLTKHEIIVSERTRYWETKEGTSEDVVKPCGAEECMNVAKENPRCNKYPHPETDKNPAPDSELGEENLKGLVEDLASNGTMCGTNVFENYNGSLTSETLLEDQILCKEIKIPSEAAGKPNENADYYQKSSHRQQPEPEETNHSSFELSLEEAVENLKKADFVPVSSLEKASDGVESDVWKNASKICESDACRLLENLSTDLSLKNNFKNELPEMEFSRLKKSELSFEEVKFSPVNTNNENGSKQNEADASEKGKKSELEDCCILEKTKNYNKNTLKDTNDLSIKLTDEIVCENANSERNDDSTQNIISSKFEVLTENEEFLQQSIEIGFSEHAGGKVLEGESIFTQAFENYPKAMGNSASENVARDGNAALTLPSNFEVEDGEIIESSDEIEEKAGSKEQITDAIQPFDGFLIMNKTQKRRTDFIIRKIERRHSMKPDKLRKKTESQNSELKTWSRRKFSKAKSCPPIQKFPEGLLLKKEEMLSVPVEEIPLPFGPPPLKSCHNFKKSMSSGSQVDSAFTEAKEKLKESISPKRSQVSQKEIPQPNSPSCCSSPFDMSNLQNCRNPSPPVLDQETSRLGTFRRNSKIKFSFLKRSKFSKTDLKSNMDSQCKFSSQAPITESKSLEDPGKKDLASYGFKKSEEIQTLEHASANQDSILKECEMEEVSNAKEAKSCQEDSEEIQKSETDLEQPVQSLCEDLDESVRVIDVIGDFMRDEFYECEDIPTSEDLTNGDDMENEKVNDDKFRNIMQNCLDNAKKFLNVENLKLFSCSIDDLLELDCQTSESGLGDKPTNHISRDVLLTSCEDTNDELGLSENVPPADISMDFVPSFCSDVCPEILPVDNWPYLEEEVASSPTKSRQDDGDLIPPLENASSITQSESRLKFSTKNRSERPCHARKRVVSETNMKSYRRRSLISDEETLRMCSKIGAQRRKTIDSFTEMPCGSDIRNIKNELVKLKNGTKERERKSLKCRLSLEKLTTKHGLNFEFKKDKLYKNGMRVKGARNLDYKSPSWQPKVMLFRISKNELKKIVGNPKALNQWGPNNSKNSQKKENSCYHGNDDMSSVIKEKFETKFEERLEEVKIEEKRKFGDEKLVSLPQFDSIKGSLTVVSSKDPNVKKRRKARFRNLHSKRKPEPGTFKNENTSGQNNRCAESSPFDAEVALTKLFKHCSRGSNVLNENSKEMVNPKDGDEKFKKSTVTESDQKASLKSEKRLEKETEPLRSYDKSKESKDDKCFSEKSEKTHDHRDRRREKSEGREQHIHKYKHKENEREKHRKHDRSKRLDKKISSGKNGERCRTTSGEIDSERKSQKAATHESPWTCEVCGFDNASERVLHIKSHPFHCQSCYLAFKTETHFIGHLTKNHKDIRNQHHCLLCELSFDTEEQYYKHLETREHRHLECVEKNTINTLFTLLTGAPCPVLGLAEMKPEWLPNQSGTVHFYHQATPLSLALQYLKMHQDLSSFSAASSIHPT